MLQFIRDRAQGWIAGVIVAFLVLALSSIAWDAYFSPDPEVPVAKVDGNNISSAAYQRAYQNQRARIQNMIGDANIDISLLIPDEDVFRKNIVKQLVDEQLILQAAVDAGLRISDRSLSQQIRNISAFKNDGEFSAGLYEQWLNQNRLSSAEFEDMLRRDELLSQYRSSILVSAWTSEEEQNQLLALQMQQRDIAYVTLPAANYLEKADVSDAAIRERYDADQSEYATPERISIEYIELSMADLIKDIDVDESTLEEQYQDRQSEFGVPEERRVRHIMIEVAADSSSEEQAKAKETAASLLDRLNSGESFEELASEHSDDIGSAKAGGDLGFLAQDMMMDPAFSDAAFKLEKSEVSELVKTAYGWHIIKLEAINKGKLKPFAEVRDQLAADYKHQQAQDHFFDQGESLANIAFENPDTLLPAMEQLGLKIKTTPLFTRAMGVGIAMDPKVRDIAFSEDVLQRNNNSEPLELGTDRLIVLRVKEHQISKIKPFDTVSETIKAELKQQNAEALAAKHGKEIIEALDAGKSPEELLEPLSLDWTRHLAVKRDDTAINNEVVNSVFRIVRPEAGQSSYAGFKMKSGDYAVVAVTSVIDVDVDAADESKRQDNKQQRERYYGSSELLGVMDDMRNNAEVIEYPENFL